MVHKRYLIALALALVSALALFVRAEKPNMPPESLAKIATHIVVGEVQAIYTRTEESGGWETTHYLAELRVDASEKGAGLTKGQLIYVRYWTRHWTSRLRPMPASTTGHRGLPEAGESLRIYLAKNAYDGFDTKAHNDDGGFNVVGANGFERLAKPADE